MNVDAIQPDNTPKYPKLKPWQILQLQRELALGDQTHDQLAEKYGKPQTAISQFAGRHRAEIQAIRHADGEALAALWIAQKVNRVAEYQADADELAGSEDPAMRRLRQAALRSVAEELGQLTQKVDTTAVVEYRITGLDPEALK